MMVVALLLGACQSNDHFIDQVVEDGEGTVNFMVSAPDALGVTRAYNAGSNSAKGGITNVDCANDYDLRYQLAIYRVDANGPVQIITPQIKTVDTYSPVSYSLKLAPNKTYRVVVWADFVTQGSA